MSETLSSEGKTRGRPRKYPKGIKKTTPEVQNDYYEKFKYNKLLKENKKFSKIIKVHADMARKIEYIYTLRSHLINEFHEKKGKLKLKKYHLIHDEYNLFYNKVLFMSGWNTSLDFYPCVFKGRADHIMFRELNVNKFGDIEMRHLPSYYGVEYDFEFSKYKLDDSDKLTREDIEKCNKFKAKFLKFIDSYIKWINEYELDKQSILSFEKFQKKVNKRFDIGIIPFLD